MASNVNSWSRFVVSMPPRIELRSGTAPWLHRAQRLAYLLAALGLLFSPAAWPWQSASIAALACAWVVSERHASRHSTPGRLVLHLDGRLLLSKAGKDRHGIPVRGAWVSRWFCIVRWSDNHNGLHHNTLVCASENHPDDYRRLLAWLRLDAFGKQEAAV